MLHFLQLLPLPFSLHIIVAECLAIFAEVLFPFVLESHERPWRSISSHIVLVLDRGPSLTWKTKFFKTLDLEPHGSWDRGDVGWLSRNFILRTRIRSLCLFDCICQLTHPISHGDRGWKEGRGASLEVHLVLLAIGA